ncbi:hypothetical protein HHI36_008780 [Cryptolaemus montrouzieri]|uniref:Uncharacterized protein n=1 Tax=Cryptolaemus montrouzieri TaxID=559131 RepID=A0ABD2MU95_9CUCU
MSLLSFFNSVIILSNQSSIMSSNQLEQPGFGDDIIVVEVARGITSRQFGSVTIIDCASATVGAKIWELNNSAAAATHPILDVVVFGSLSICGISVINQRAKSLFENTDELYGQIPHFLNPFTAVDIKDAHMKVFPRISATCRIVTTIPGLLRSQAVIC